MICKKIEWTISHSVYLSTCPGLLFPSSKLGLKEVHDRMVISFSFALNFVTITGPCTVLKLRHGIIYTCSVVLFPVAVTFLITWWFIQFVDGFFSPLYDQLGIDIFGKSNLVFLGYQIAFCLCFNYWDIRHNTKVLSHTGNWPFYSKGSTFPIRLLFEI